MRTDVRSVPLRWVEFPIGDLKPAEVIEAAGFALDAQQAMRGGTAAALFGLRG